MAKLAKFIMPEKFEDKLSKLSFSSDYGSADSMSIPSTPTTPCSPLPDFDIVPIQESDREEVLKFLQTFFFKDEPLNHCINLINDESPRCLELEEFSLKDLKNGLNLKAVLDGRMIGVCLNGMLERGFVNDIDLNDDTIKHPKFSKIVKLLDFVAKDLDVFQHFPDCDKAMYVKIISVDTTLRGRGLAKHFLSKTRDLAKEHGCGFMTVDCTSHFSAMALAKLNFNLTYTLKYSDYKVDGEVVFQPEEPHTAVTVYTQRVN